MSALGSLWVALIIAYLLDPAVDFFSRYGKNPQPYRRTAGTVLVYTAIFAVFIAVIIFAFIKIGANSFDSYAENFAGIISQAREDLNFDDIFAGMIVKMAELNMLGHISGYLYELVSQVSSFFQGIVYWILDGLSAAGRGLFKFLLGLIAAFYILRDKKHYMEKISQTAKAIMPEKIYKFISNFLAEIHEIFYGYIRGQLIAAAILAVLIGIFLSIIGVRYAFIIGILSGVANLIPYFGAIISFFLAIAMALLGGEPITALYAAIGIIIIQQIDAFFIIPKVVGKRIELPPPVIILSLAIAGELFGITGMIFAVPVCAVFRIILKKIESCGKMP